MTDPMMPTVLARSYVSRYAGTHMTAVIRIDRLGDVVTDKTTGQAMAPVIKMVYTGKARVAEVAGPMTLSIGDEPMYASSTYVMIPLVDVATGLVIDPMIDDVVAVSWHDDPLMIGRAFRVMDVEASGFLLAVRKLQVTGVDPSKTWTLPDPDAVPVTQVPPEWLV